MDVVVTQVGMGGGSVPLIVEDDTRLLAEAQVELGPDGEPVDQAGVVLHCPGRRRDDQGQQ